MILFYWVNKFILSGVLSLKVKAMKRFNHIFCLMLLTLFAGTTLTALSQSLTYPHVDFQDMTGKFLDAGEVIPADEKVIVVFWNSNNPKHIEHLDALHEELNGQNNYGASRIIAISTDKYHLPQKLRSLVAGKAWGFDVYIDVNQNFSRMYAICDEQLQAYTFHQGRKSAVEILRPELLPQDFLAELYP